MIKRIILLFVQIAVITMLFSGCGDNKTVEPPAGASEPPTKSSVFPSKVPWDSSDPSSSIIIVNGYNVATTDDGKIIIGVYGEKLGIISKDWPIIGQTYYISNITCTYEAAGVTYEPVNTLLYADDKDNPEDATSISFNFDSDVTPEKITIKSTAADNQSVIASFNVADEAQMKDK